MLRAAIFDMDGLLADTEWPDYVTWRDLFRDHGGELLIEEWVGQVGVWGTASIKERFAAVCAAGVDLEVCFADRRARFHEQVAALSPLPGVDSLLSALSSRGVPCAVASSSDSEWVGYVLGTLGLRERLAAVVTGDDVRARKPAPDVYLEAARRLGVAAGECVAFEDSAVGVSAAIAAGMRCVVVPNRLTSLHDLSHAHVRVASLDEIDILFLDTLLVP